MALLSDIADFVHHAIELNRYRILITPRITFIIVTSKPTKEPPYEPLKPNEPIYILQIQHPPTRPTNYPTSKSSLQPKRNTSEGYKARESQDSVYTSLTFDADGRPSPECLRYCFPTALYSLGELLYCTSPALSRLPGALALGSALYSKLR